MVLNKNPNHLDVSSVNFILLVFFSLLLGVRTWRGHIDSITGLEYIDQST